MLEQKLSASCVPATDYRPSQVARLYHVLHNLAEGGGAIADELCFHSPCHIGKGNFYPTILRRSGFLFLDF